MTTAGARGDGQGADSAEGSSPAAGEVFDEAIPSMKTRIASFLALLSAVSLALALVLLGFERAVQEPENYSRIEEGLYLGGDVGRPPPGVRAVVNLCEKPDPYRTEVEVWEPIPDAEPAPSVEWLRRMVGVIDTERKAGLPTYVHCRNGASRSGMVVTAYEMFKNHWTRDEALTFVRSKRPEVRPNPAFMARLAEWERVLKEESAGEQPGNRP